MKYNYFNFKSLALLMCFVGVRNTVVLRATHMQVYAGLSPISTDHRKELISALSCSLNDVK